jgi:hypothetical protein
VAGAAQVAGSGIYVAAHPRGRAQVAGAGAGPHQDPSYQSGLRQHGRQLLQRKRRR